jgi:RepB DNA-primase from phage plasmid/Primase C terminal 2 (PriCT-2)
MGSPSNLTVSQRLTRAFLRLLDHDAKTKTFHFRTFDDKKDRKRVELIGKLSGTINSCEQKLGRRNAKEAGVFVVINAGGQTDAEITSVRAVFADTDGAPLEPIVGALAPHCVISTSPGKWHVYWLVDEGFQLDRFTPIQKAIAKKFGTDPKVINLSRVMRVPGFAHNKDDPFDVHFYDLKNWEMPHYSVEQIVDGLGLHEIEQSRTEGVSTSKTLLWSQEARYSKQYNLPEVAEMLRFIKPWSDRKRWMDVIFALAHEYGEAGRELAVRWSRGPAGNGSSPLAMRSLIIALRVASTSFQLFLA